MPSRRCVAPVTASPPTGADVRRASIRFRLTAIAVSAVVVVLTGVAFGLVTAQRSQLTTSMDTNLRQRAGDIEALLRSATEVPPALTASQQEGFTQLVAAGGPVIAASPNLSGAKQLPIAYDVGRGDRLQTLSGLPVDDDPFRVLSRTVEVDGLPAVLHVGTNYDVVGDSTEALTTSLAISIPVVVVLLAGLVWWLVGRTLGPVEDIRAEVAAITAANLSRRVPEPTTGDEIASLAGTMNQMLSRIETAVEQQQRFVADASHELRSPLTRMRSELEVDLITAEGENRNRLESVRDEVVELQRLVEDLLQLARADAGKERVPAEPVDLDDIVLDEAKQLQASGRVTVDMTAVSGAQVVGDHRQLRRAIHNVADNAGRHATALVTFTLRETNGMAEMTVADDGPGIAANKAELIFERFGRIDESRSRHQGGTGLGLAIARDIARRHGGDLVIDPSHEGGAKFLLRLPVA